MKRNRYTYNALGEIESIDKLSFSPMFYKPISSMDVQDYGSSNIPSYMILLKKGTDILPNDKIEIDGQEYEIETFYPVQYKEKVYVIKVILKGGG
ncbi:MAG: hypothetical protein L6Q54_11665 [Leptospiraceae bacterium]|nr:hypothetical protein [Leptospiraceae bacterium]